MAALSLLAGCGGTDGERSGFTGHGATGGALPSAGGTGTGGATNVGAGGSWVRATIDAPSAEPATPWPDPGWPSGDPNAEGFDPALLDAAASMAEAQGSYCWLVIRHGRLVAERYWNGHDETTLERSWSIAKSYASTLVGIAIARGDFSSLDQSVADFVPEWKGSERDAITFRHVLSMTSGLKWSAFDDYFVMATLAPNHTEHALGRPLADPPGTKWIYDNAAVQILEPAFRNATGKTIEQYAQAHLWSKLGMTASWAHDPAGNPTAYASVMASCRDHARLGYLYLHGGRWKDEQVVPSEFVKSALTPSQTINRAYGFLWWLNGHTPALDAMMEPWPGQMVPFAPPDHFAARGFGNQFVDVFPKLDLMVVRFGPDPLATFDLAALTQDQKFEKHDLILEPVLGALVD